MGLEMTPGEYSGGPMLLGDEESQNVILQQMWEDVANLASSNVNATAVYFTFSD